MNDIKKQQLKRVDKVVQTVADGYTNELRKQNLQKLEDRRGVLIQRVNDENLSDHSQKVADLQLNEIEQSITELREQIDWDMEYNTDMTQEEEDQAKQFLADNPDIVVEGGEIVYQNTAVDELEKELYGKKGSDQT